MKLPKQSKAVKVTIPIGVHQEVGLGQVVKRVTGAFGIEPCNSCHRRAEFLDRHVVFGGRTENYSDSR